ncbi:MAG: DUF6472 family protein [Bacillota bacterium]|uniref:DUF6472 domain-containing protein n=1 Tax=[Clostridium] aminophilum TaxID=1526 RepID=A0A1I6JLT2_9FIRM|nr:DUF6472 family protein [[Clostridium] aminophilum]MDT3844810.1 DUF6472 family protein [Bacillota bacterium]SFR79938.1 hypothetical protein SAMN02910262_01660 [[Clostridium] aminophilum]
MGTCETCAYYAYDEDEDDYFCEAQMDEDDYARILEGHYKQCPFYRNDDEYAVVRHQAFGR